jgi:anhydro-N-acetylmuramic acid kinase
MLIDALATILYGIPCDTNGHIAARGHVHTDMLACLLAHPYFSQPPPKSTGREQFGEPYAKTILEHWQPLIPPDDLMASVTQLTATTIAKACQHFVMSRMSISEMLIGGGGIYNTTLTQMLQDELTPLGVTLRRHDDVGISSTYKEAIAFALLGYARVCGIPNNMPTCTGARHPVVMGGIWHAS